MMKPVNNMKKMNKKGTLYNSSLSSVDGVTLVELLIAVAIIGILAAVAYPSYQSSITKSGRNDAMSTLTSFAQAMERFYTMKGSYVGALDVDGDGTNDQSIDATTLVFDIFPTQAPLSGTPKLYTLAIEAASSSGYTLSAKPIAGTQQEGDGVILLDSTGTRAWDSDNTSASASLSSGLINTSTYASELCWKRAC